MGVVVWLSSSRSYGTVGESYPGFSNNIIEGFTTEHIYLTYLGTEGCTSRSIV